MLRKLLADRFQLKTHSIQKIFPVYALTISDSASKLSKSDPSANNHGNLAIHQSADGQTLIQCIHMSMPELVDLLMNFIGDRQIVDETGLTGNFDFPMTVLTRVLGGDHGTDDNDKAAAFIRAVEPLGFGLVPKKESLAVIVIDHVEKPSPN